MNGLELQCTLSKLNILNRSFYGFCYRVDEKGCCNIFAYLIYFSVLNFSWSFISLVFIQDAVISGDENVRESPKSSSTRTCCH